MDLQFFDYPSEVHLQNGAVCFERNSGIFYSADLMLRFGNGAGKRMAAKWVDEVSAIDEERIPSEKLAEKLKLDLLTVSPLYIAVGHGFCLECKK